MDRIKILYIVGWGRSGTTILDRILGQIEGFNSVGEIRYIWDRNFIDNHLCGCGRRFRECPEWRAIIEDAYGSFDAIDSRRMIELRDHLTRTRHTIGLIMPGALRQVMWNKARDYLESLTSLYRAIRDHHRSRVIVDSSKFPTYAYTLDILPEIDLHVIHLVRDPRAVAFSWLRRKLQPDTGTLQPMDEHGPVFSTLLWNSWNIATEVMWLRRRRRYTFIRYEDFIARPRATIERIVRRIGETDVALPFIEDHIVHLGIDHTCSGNPNRFRDGTIELKLDNEWENRMRARDRVAVSAVAAPLLSRYGYRL